MTSFKNSDEKNNNSFRDQDKDGLHVWRSASNISEKEAAAIAMRTQQIVAFETDVADTADPLARNFNENLAGEVEKKPGN